MKRILLTLCATFAFLSGTSYGNDIPGNLNRITNNPPGQQRCWPTPQDLCTRKHDRALELSYINQKEFNTLKTNNDFALCDYAEAPILKMTAKDLFDQYSEFDL